MKYQTVIDTISKHIVALFTRAWIEIKKDYNLVGVNNVALFTRAWIEIGTSE